MWSSIGAYLAANWVQWVVGVVTMAFVGLLKHDFKLWKKDFHRQQEEFADALKKEIIAKSQEDDEAIQGEVDSIKEEMGSLKAGILSMQGREFKAQCRRLLAENHTITLDEWEEIDADHDAYNGLGGNHTGDHLFGLVKTKFESSLRQQ